MVDETASLLVQCGTVCGTPILLYHHMIGTKRSRDAIREDLPTRENVIFTYNNLMYLGRENEAGLVRTQYRFFVDSFGLEPTDLEAEHQRYLESSLIKGLEDALKFGS